MSDRAHYPQLDGVRALAVIAVFVGHFLSATVFAKVVGWGDTGVILFFCLSGFLITEILLRIDTTPGNRGPGFFAFYARRFLRIVPIYYLTLAALLIAGYTPVTDHAWRFLTYTLNVPGMQPTDNLGAAGHFWSLSVEEQFYIAWPTVVVFWPRTKLRALIITIVLASFSLKLALAASGSTYTLVFWHVLGCMDSLGLGAWLAIRKWEARDHPAALAPFIRAGQIAAVGWLVLSVFRISRGIDPWFDGYLPFGVVYFGCSAVAFVGLVASAVRGSRQWFGAVLASSPMRYIGKISYGLYVYHFFMPYAVRWANAHGYLTTTSAWDTALYSTGLSVLVAVVSWHVLERPLLELKRHFPTTGRPNRATRGQTVAHHGMTSI